MGATLVQLIAGVDFHLRGHLEHACEMYMRSPALIVIALAFMHQRRLVLFLAAACLADVAAQLLAVSLLKARHQPPAFDHGVSTVAAVLGALVVSVLALRLLALWQSQRLIRQDEAAYNRAWEATKRGDHTDGSIGHLHAVTRMIGLDESRACRQYNRRHTTVHSPRAAPAAADSPLLRRLGVATVPNTMDYSSPITSLDQLYAAASAANSVVLPKVKAWARASNGLVPVAQQGGEGGTRLQYLAWADVEGTALERFVKWSLLKGQRRACEKAMRCFANDPSRLLDICRHSIVFSTLTELTMCLGQIMLDDEIVIDRLKNRYTDLYDSSQTAGYRDVMLNFHVRNKTTAMLGAESHICELQLVLLGFAQIRSNEGHQRYISWRNYRAQ
eukprot:CAMPEP_0206245362 /NCGR_PEP_ID=MMETSP0047_2-20121206/18655_1 /ASSEMBLY_ACC=CAM_ASM_000192 /TAXON_ID=195065 /ORGANISM="Chroomonas mesostigmatica_cf, Strain CCMP1168" /LENGTH=387 /DNA_ID=CAMNT_0053670653 /DNA_START=132 /DNA_END=1295 /DNA_ORIENTATION=+